MRRFLALVAVCTLFASIFHGLLWWQDKDIYKELGQQAGDGHRDQTGNIKQMRLRLEGEQMAELKEYKWINRREENVQIPIERGIHYYLESLPHE